MPNEPDRIYWDSCAYISCIEQSPGRGDALRNIVSQAEVGEIVFVASAFVIAEVTKLKRSSESDLKQFRMIRDFFKNDFIRVRAVDRMVAEKAQEISRQHKVKPGDAVHIATACIYKCTSFQTYDGEKKESNEGNPSSTKGLLRLDGKIGVPPLKIEIPRRVSPPGGDQKTFI